MRILRGRREPEYCYTRKPETVRAIVREMGPKAAWGKMFFKPLPDFEAQERRKAEAEKDRINAEAAERWNKMSPEEQFADQCWRRNMS